MAHPVCATGTWSRAFLGPEFGWAAAQSHNLTPRFRQKLSELSKVEPAEDRLDELILVALGGNETFYLAYKTRKGEYRQDSFDLNPGLHAFLFPKDGTTRDFATLQVVMNWGWTYYAQDKNGRVFEKLPPNLEKALKERSEQSQWPRTLALGPSSTYVYVGRDEHTEISLAAHQKDLQALLGDAEEVKKVEYLYLDPYNDWRNYLMCFSDGAWTAFLHGQVFNGQLTDTVKRASGRIGAGDVGATPAISKEGAATLLRDKETAETALKESQERYEADLKRMKDELTQMRDRLKAEHEKDLQEQKNKTTDEELDLVKAQHQRDLQQQKLLCEKELRSQHQKELQDQKNAYEKKLKTKGGTGVAGLPHEEHTKELEQLKQDFEAKLLAKDKEIRAIKSNSGDYSRPPTFLLGSNTNASAMPTLGSMSMMFQSAEYQLGTAVEKAWEEGK